MVNNEISQSEYLRRLSQCSYNLIVILDIHLKSEHYFDKRLDQFYTDSTKEGGEKEKLFQLLDYPVGIKKFSFKRKILDKYLISNSCDTEKEIRKIKNAKQELNLLLREIQEERKKENDFIATTGLEDGDLKDFIINIVDEKKKDYNLALLGIKEETSKKQRVYLPKFPRTDWANVVISFIDENNGLISNSKETKPLTPGIVGCIDGRTQKPKKAWLLLVLISKNNGILETGRSINETTRKTKEEITDILRNIFQNDTDPFENNRQGSYKAKFKISFNKIEVGKNFNKNDDKFLDNEEIFYEMTKANSDDLDYDVKNNLNWKEDRENSQ